MNLNQEQYDALLKIAGKKLGTTPENLKAQIESGTFDSAIKGMNQQQANLFRQAVSDPKFAEKILSSPQAQELYKRLSNNQKG